jgi:hypothetical protein
MPSKFGDSVAFLHEAEREGERCEPELNICHCFIRRAKAITSSGLL